MLEVMRRSAEGKTREGAAPYLARGRQLAALSCLFVRRFLSIETIAPGADVKEALAPILTLLALPGYVLSLVAFTGAAAMRHDPTLLYSARWLLLIWSFVVVGVLATVQWEAFFLDRSDRMTLGALPVRGTEIFIAKLAALLFSVAVFHVSINLMSGLVFPVSFLPHYLHAAAVHQLVLLLQSLFVAFAVASLQGAIVHLCPRRLARQASHAAQALLLVGLASLLMLQEELGRWVRDARGSDALVNQVFPPAWFMTLYDRLSAGSATPPGLPAALAVVAPVGALGVAALLCLVSMHVRPSTTEATGFLSTRGLPLLDRAIESGYLRSPREVAIHGFIRRALREGGRARLTLLAWVAAGVALSLSFVLPALQSCTARQGGASPALLAPAHVMTLFGLVGLRLSAAMPVELEAHWIFRLMRPPPPREYIRATRAAALSVVIVPLLVVIGLFSLATSGLATAAGHVALALLVALATLELLFLGFEKVPFTCSYVPGRAQLRVRWPFYVAIGLVYCGVLPRIEAWVLRSPAVVAATIVGLGGLVWALQRGRESLAARAQGPIFDESPPALITRLDLGS